MKIFELMVTDDIEIILTIMTEAKTIIQQLSQRSHHDQSESLASIIEFFSRGDKPMKIFELMVKDDIEIILTIMTEAKTIIPQLSQRSAATMTKANPWQASSNYVHEETSQ